MRKLSLACGLLGLSGVVLGALGAHALNARLAAHDGLATWDTAVLFHLVHAAALPGLVAWREASQRGAVRGRDWLGWAGGSWVIGTLLFSGSLYILALGGPRWLGPVPPLGGIAYIIGWFSIMISAVQKPTPSIPGAR